MNKKLMVLVLVVALLFVAAGVVSAATSTARTINLLPGMSLDVVCEGGDILASVDNSNLTAVAHITCYNAFPP